MMKSRPGWYWIFLLTLLTAVDPAVAQQGRLRRSHGEPGTTIGVQAFRVSDDDGGRLAQIEGRDIEDLVAFASECFAQVGIRFAFDFGLDCIVLEPRQGRSPDSRRRLPGRSREL
jgi:hypothetical protein